MLRSSWRKRAHRVFYIAKFGEAVYVLHAFARRARKTPKPEVELARNRLRELLAQRRRKDAAQG